MYFSVLLLVSKKHLHLKCAKCRRLLPSHFYKSVTGPSHSLTCMSCKPMCVMCGIRKPLECFSENKTTEGTNFARSTLSHSSSDSPLGALLHSQREDIECVGAASGDVKRVCDSCVAREYVAKTNVYFRYPILKYRACPFSVDEYRETLAEEDKGPTKSE